MIITLTQQIKTMEKKAYLVTCEFITRVILDESEVGDDNVLEQMIKQNLIHKIENDEILENITDMKEDTECPYQPKHMKYKVGDEVRVKIPEFVKLFGDDCVWVVYFIKLQLEHNPSLYACYRKDDKSRTLFQFMEEELE